MVVRDLAKVEARVRFPYPAPTFRKLSFDITPTPQLFQWMLYKSSPAQPAQNYTLFRRGHGQILCNSPSVCSM